MWRPFCMLAVAVTVWVAFLWSPYGFYGRPMEYGRPLYFHPVVSSSFFFFFSSPNLSRRRLDVYHTSTHGVALVPIWDSGLKHAARGSL